jgi:ATP-dependent RNA helicase DeaD
VARRRALIERAVNSGALDETLILLSPLFERHEPSVVASALYHLWVTEPRQAAAPTEATKPATARIWVSAGKKDQIGPDDLVGMLANQIRLDRSQIGRIDSRETFSLIEVPAALAERTAEALSGKTLKRKRLLARVDRQDERPRGGRPERKPRRPS